MRDSCQTASHICTYLVPINCTIIVDVQHTFHFDRDFISDLGQGHKKLCFPALFIYDGWYFVCVTQPKPLHIFSYLVPINCTIIVDVQHTFHFDLDFISDPGQRHEKTLFSCILYIRRVELCVCDSAQTASHICTHLVPINCTITVDVQHTFHFDLDLILDPGQGHKNLVFSACFI